MNVRTLSVIFNFFLIVLAFAAMNVAQAQEVQVNSANPNSALQGTVDLDVEISGSGFDNSAAVDFFVHGTTNRGGITVKNVKARGSKKIIATIDVDPLADVDDFDIEVRLSGGRNGKGTTLFRVLKKGRDGGTFKVTVFIGGIPAGYQDNVEGQNRGNRRKLGDATMGLTLDGLKTAFSLPDECAPSGFGTPIGLFAAGTYQDAGSGEFTYIEADFYHFGVDGNEITWHLLFAHDDRNVVVGPWFPGVGETASLTGDKLTLQAEGPDRKGPCNGTITQVWKIEAEGEPPM